MARGLRIGSKGDVVRTLRALLRLSRKRSSAENFRDCSWSQCILSTYRERQHETHRAKMRHYRAEADDMLMMLRGVEDKERLMELDAGAERKLSSQDIVNRSAHRVGLAIPESFAEKEERLRRERAEAAAAKYREAKGSKTKTAV